MNQWVWQQSLTVELEIKMSFCVEYYLTFTFAKQVLMPRLHLLRSSCDLFVYDFSYDFLRHWGGNKLRRMCLHCLQSPYDFFGDKLGQNLTETLRISLRPPYINRMMPIRWPCGSRKESVRWLCNCHVIMCMDLKGHPCSFLDSIWTVYQSHVITNHAMKRLLFLVEHGPKVWNSVIRLCIF